MSYCLKPACSQPQNRNVDYCFSCGSPLLLQERYRPLKLIGQGGFGRTFLAVDESDSSKLYCAIKQFFPQTQSNDHTSALRQEALKLAALGKHPQIPELLAYCEQDGHQYLVQEFINGQNLEQELAETGAFNESEIRELLNDLLPVLQLVHERQIVHRDIKPANIIRRCSDSKLVLVDFGAAKSAGNVAQTGTMIGSAEYAAPEQVRGKAVFASDLYSLGVTCVYLLTHIPPFDLFDGGEDRWVWRDYLSFPVSESLGQLLDKLLQNATKRRYQSAAAVLQELNSLSTPVVTNSLSVVEAETITRHEQLSETTKPTNSSGSATVLSATVFDPQTQSWHYLPNIFEHSESVWAVAPYLRPLPTPPPSTTCQVIPQVATTTAVQNNKKRPWLFLAAVVVAVSASLAVKIRTPFVFPPPATENTPKFQEKVQHL